MIVVSQLLHPTQTATFKCAFSSYDELHLCFVLDVLSAAHHSLCSVVAHNFYVDGQMRSFKTFTLHRVVESVLVGVAFHRFAVRFGEDKTGFGCAGFANRCSCFDHLLSLVRSDAACSFTNSPLASNGCSSAFR